MQAVKDVIKGGYAAAMCGSGLLDAWLRVRPGRGRIAILNYHWIAPDVFADHLRWLRRSYRILSLEACVSYLLGDGPAPANAVVLTFDDAYVQFHDEIVPVLRRFDAPAALFIPTGSIDSQAPLWCNRVKACVFAMPDGELTIGPATIVVSGPRRTVYHAVIRELNAMPIEERDACIASLFKDIRGDADVLRRYAPMTWPQLRRLTPLVSLGAHSVTHPNLAMLSGPALSEEILASRHTIESETWRPVRHFAYPFGQPHTVTATAAAAVRDGGFAVGLTTLPGTCGPGDDAYRLPRLVCDDISTGRLLAARLSNLWVRMST